MKRRKKKNKKTYRFLTNNSNTLSKLFEIIVCNWSTIDFTDLPSGATPHPSWGIKKDDESNDGNDGDDDQQRALPFTKGVQHRVVISNQ